MLACALLLLCPGCGINGAMFGRIQFAHCIFRCKDNPFLRVNCFPVCCRHLHTKCLDEQAMKYDTVDDVTTPVRRRIAKFLIQIAPSYTACLNFP